MLFPSSLNTILACFFSSSHWYSIYTALGLSNSVLAFRFHPHHTKTSHATLRRPFLTHGLMAFRAVLNILAHDATSQVISAISHMAIPHSHATSQVSLTFLFCACIYARLQATLRHNVYVFDLIHKFTGLRGAFGSNSSDTAVLQCLPSCHVYPLGLRCVVVFGALPCMSFTMHHHASSKHSHRDARKCVHNMPMCATTQDLAQVQGSSLMQHVVLNFLQWTTACCSIGAGTQVNIFLFLRLASMFFGAVFLVAMQQPVESRRGSNLTRTGMC